MDGRITKELLFKVIVGDHEYCIYTNGRIEGFGDDAKVINNYPRLRFGPPQEGITQKVLDEDIVCQHNA